MLQAKCRDQIRWSHAYLKNCGLNLADAIQFKAEFNPIPNIRKFAFFVYSRISYLVAVTNTGHRASNLDLCFNSEGFITCHTYCDTGSRFMRSHPKDLHPRPTMRFEFESSEISELCVINMSVSLNMATILNIYYKI